MGATVVSGVLVIVAATVNDGVLHLTFANELRDREGLDAAVAVVKAAKIRLRPRVMTTIAILVGFIPLALAIEEGGDMLQPMAAGRHWRPADGNAGGSLSQALPLSDFYRDRDGRSQG